MKKERGKSKYVEWFYVDETNLFQMRYLPATIDMTDQEWRDEMQKLVSIYEKYRPEYIIDDNRERLYEYSPEMQEWTLSLFTGLWNRIGLKKYVQIIPTEIIGKLTSMQIEEMAVSDFERQFQHKLVENYEGALSWINEVY